MRATAVYKGNNEALLFPRHGVGEMMVKTNFILEGEGKNEPELESVIMLDLPANERDQEMLVQEENYRRSKDTQNEKNPPSPVWPEPKPPRKKANPDVKFQEA